MSEIVERAAIAIFDVRERRFPMDSNEEAARAALLAALDLEDEAMVEQWARAHWNGTPAMRNTLEPTTSTTHPYEWRGSPVLWDDDDMSDHDKAATIRGARAAISALRSMVLPNEKGSDRE